MAIDYKEWRICDKCPCLNTDYENGSNCNMGYDTDLIWFDEKGNSVWDKVEIEKHHFDLFNASKNCQIIKIEAKDKTIYFK